MKNSTHETPQGPATKEQPSSNAEAPGSKNETRIDIKSAMRNRSLNHARREALRQKIEESGLSEEQIVEKLDIDVAEMEQWIEYLKKIRMDNEMTSVPLQRAEKLAPALECSVSDLLIKYTDVEKETAGIVEEESVATAETTKTPRVAKDIAPEQLQKMRSEALDHMMSEKSTTAENLASLLEKDPYNRSVLAMQIAEYRQGLKMIPSELCTKITTALQIDAVTLYIQLLPEESKSKKPKRADGAIKFPSQQQKSSTGGKSERKPGTRKQKSSGKRSARTQEETERVEVHLEPQEEVIAHIALSQDEFHKLFGDSVELIQKENGRYLAKMPEKTLTKDEVIQLLLKQVKK